MSLLLQLTIIFVSLRNYDDSARPLRSLILLSQITAPVGITFRIVSIERAKSGKSLPTSYDVLAFRGDEEVGNLYVEQFPGGRSKFAPKVFRSSVISIMLYTLAAKESFNRNGKLFSSSYPSVSAGYI